jgi:hypothetical protein
MRYPVTVTIPPPATATQATPTRVTVTPGPVMSYRIEALGPSGPVVVSHGDLTEVPTRPGDLAAIVIDALDRALEKGPRGWRGRHRFLHAVVSDYDRLCREGPMTEVEALDALTVTHGLVWKEPDPNDASQSTPDR